MFNNKIIINNTTKISASLDAQYDARWRDDSVGKKCQNGQKVCLRQIYPPLSNNIVKNTFDFSDQEHKVEVPTKTQNQGN